MLNPLRHAGGDDRKNLETPRRRAPQNIMLSLPEWLEQALPADGQAFPKVEDRMRLAIRLAHLNITNGTGGPFGAAVFTEQAGILVSPGINLVVHSNFSIAHAEIIAITLAQQAFNTYELGKPGMPRLQLVTSAEPCAMCFGAIIWSGIRTLVCGAREEDVHAIGFDEGAKITAWVSELEQRGISVMQDVARQEAISVLQAYRASGGPIYNGSPFPKKQDERIL